MDNPFEEYLNSIVNERQQTERAIVAINSIIELFKSYGISAYDTLHIMDRIADILGRVKK